MKKLVLSLVALVGFVAVSMAQDVSEKKEVEAQEIKKIEVSENIKATKAVNAEYKATPVETKKTVVAVEKKEVSEMAIEEKEVNAVKEESTEEKTTEK